MRELAELINRDDPAWPMVKQWIAEATNPVEVLPAPEPDVRGAALVQTQVTTRSPMGAIIYKTGGLLIDHGWLRILGSGHPGLPRTLPGWNQGRTMAGPGQSPPFLLVADDVVGGSFAIDGGGLGFEAGKICYFAQDRLEWENTGLGYSEFIRWSLSGNITGFYEDLRWPGWEEEVRSVAGDQAFSIYPFLCAAGPPLAERSRRPVPMAEIYDMLGPGNVPGLTG